MPIYTLKMYNTCFINAALYLFFINVTIIWICMSFVIGLVFNNKIGDQYDHQSFATRFFFGKAPVLDLPRSVIVRISNTCCCRVKG